jgi:hypothetical protein
MKYDKTNRGIFISQREQEVREAPRYGREFKC